MLQTEDDLLHGQPPFADDPQGVKQHQAPHQAQYQVPVVRLFAVDLTGPSRQQVLQSPEAVLNPVAPLPRPYEPRRTDGGLQTHYVELLLPGCTDYDECHGPIRRTGGPQPRIAHPRDLLAVPPGPIAVLLQVTPLDLVSVGQCEGVGTLSFYEERALVRRFYMAHELRIAKPTIRDDQRRRQLHATAAECCHASIQHALHPVQFVTARRPRTCRVWPTDGKVDGDDQLALANDDHQEDPINTGEHAVLLPTPPGAHQAQLLAVL